MFQKINYLNLNLQDKMYMYILLSKLIVDCNGKAIPLTGPQITVRLSALGAGRPLPTERSLVLIPMRR
jgi:hypothetical protein